MTTETGHRMALGKALKGRVALGNALKENLVGLPGKRWVESKI